MSDQRTDHIVEAGFRLNDRASDGFHFYEFDDHNLSSHQYEIISTRVKIVEEKRERTTNDSHDES